MFYFVFRFHRSCLIRTGPRLVFTANVRFKRGRSMLMEHQNYAFFCKLKIFRGNITKIIVTFAETM